jgi:hypothetical protein
VSTDQQKHDAFAEVLYQKARTHTQGMSVSHIQYINSARSGKYRSGQAMPAFLGSYFNMTDQEWDALWALIYG